jgi:hypothetical protein
VESTIEETVKAFGLKYKLPSRHNGRFKLGGSMSLMRRKTIHRLLVLVRMRHLVELTINAANVTAELLLDNYSKTLTDRRSSKAACRTTIESVLNECLTVLVS